MEANDKLLSIYIDHVYNYTDSDGIFAQKIITRLKTLKDDINVTAYGDFASDSNWIDLTLKNIDDADIIIPIISPTYLFTLPISVAEKFDQISRENNKYLLPILYHSADLATHNWLVRTKIIPESNIPIVLLNNDEVDQILNEITTTVRDIILSRKKNSTNSRIEGEQPSNNNSIVFISHDHDDADFAELLKLQLEKDGIHGWLDNEKLKIGQDWREEIDSNITNSLAVIVIMTPEARKSEYVTYEWSYAWGKGKKIFPLMLKQTSLHPRLESLQYLDFTKRTSRPYEKLITSIKELMI